MRRRWLDAVLVYRQPHMLSMLALGFSAGLPFYLVFQTLSAWLRQEGIQRSTIGMLAWVGLAYTMKFLWAPVVDRLALPLITRALGRRRSWMLLAQMGIFVGLLNLSWSDPGASITRIAAWAVFTAFCAATQDIAVDAWRIESAPVDQQGAMAAAYQVGYRIALITGGALALALAGSRSWQLSYTVMAGLVGVGVITTLLTREPAARAREADLLREERVVRWLEDKAHWPASLRAAGGWFIAAVICPLTDFFARFGPLLAVSILLFMGSYRLTDFTMGSMTNSFYIDKGYTLTEVAAVVKAYGLAASVIGVIVAGMVMAKIGLLRSLVLGSAMVMLSNTGFSLLAAASGKTLLGLGLVNGFDNLALAMHGTALIAFLSSLTSVRYTATQYALFSSMYALPGKLMEGFSGFVVDAIGYPRFFLYTASLSIPALVLLYFLARLGVVKRSQAT
ncbi:MAG TPA: MFS transporter [Candidatus Polarisedimenticolaceae bacterium]|nr:MFS transporter [Candidatus Polarisedimenticolaceae bacterium]